MQLCKDIVREYVDEHLDKSDEMPHYDVYIVWYCKTLQNWKALASTTLADGMYYELTLNGDKNEIYLDAYKKFENKCIKLESDAKAMELKDTIEGMLSDDYKERFKAEYKQLCIRIKKLEKILDDFYESKISFKLTDVKLLERQAIAMIDYREILEKRARREGINLD